MHATTTLAAAKSPWCPRGYHEVTPHGTSKALWTVGCAPNSHRLRRSFLKSGSEHQRQHCFEHLNPTDGTADPKIVGSYATDTPSGSCPAQQTCCAEPCCWTQTQIAQLVTDGLLAASICDDNPVSFAGCSNLCGDTSQSHYCDDNSVQCAQDNCVMVTSCGNQVDGTARLSGNTETLAGECAACVANTQAVSDADHCLASPGFYYDGTLNECLAGSETDTLELAGATSCNQCSAGEYDHDSASSTACIQCSAGAETDTLLSVGATSCTFCSAGNYDDDSDSSTSCIQCLAGSETDTLGESGATTCTLCPENTYDHDSASSTSCSLCLAGSETNAATGATTCVTCESNGPDFYDHDGLSSTACEQCSNTPANVQAIVNNQCVACDEAVCGQHMACASMHELHTVGGDTSDDSHHLSLIHI